MRPICRLWASSGRSLATAIASFVLGGFAVMAVPAHAADMGIPSRSYYPPTPPPPAIYDWNLPGRLQFREHRQSAVRRRNRWRTDRSQLRICALGCRRGSLVDRFGDQRVDLDRMHRCLLDPTNTNAGSVGKLYITRAVVCRRDGAAWLRRERLAVLCQGRRGLDARFLYRGSSYRWRGRYCCNSGLH
jgi:hypothetical protein